MCNTSVVLLTILFATQNFSGLHLFAQSKDKAKDIKSEIQAISTTALDSAAMGNIEYSIKLLNASLTNIPQGKEYYNYRAFVHFNIGYIYSNFGEDIDQERLSAATDAYLKALKYQPNDPKTLNNLSLVLQQSGKDNMAIDQLTQAIRKDPQHEGFYYGVIGDLYSAQGSYDQAWEAYRKATSVANPDKDAGRKLIELYDEMPSVLKYQLYEQCKEFEKRGAQSLSRLGYAKILNRTFSDYEGSGGRTIADSSLLRWVATTSELGLVTLQVFSDAGLELAQHQAIQQLQRLMQKWLEGDISYSSRDSATWWRSDERRNFYLLAFEKSLGDFFMRNGQYKEAAGTYERVLQQLWHSTDYSSEIYGRPDVLLTDILVSLARAYNDPRLRMEDQWKKLEQRLFDMKGVAYATNDLANRQKFHTILGQIYFERGELTGYGAKNAEFQLSNAIQVAERRVAANSDSYYPIPNLHMNLASVYRSDGRLNDAYDILMKAAIGYLETDHLRECDQTLMEASQLSYAKSAEREQVYQLVKNIHAVRSDIPNLSREQFDGNHSDFFEKSDAFKWLKETSPNTVISKDILDRQRFKTLTDLSIRANTVGASEAHKQLSSEARTEMQNVKVISSQQDVIRMRNLEVTSAQVNYSSNYTAKQSTGTPAAKENVYSVSTPPGDPKQEVIVDKQTPKKQRRLNNKVERQ